MPSTLVKATPDHVKEIVRLLDAMQTELEEIVSDDDVSTRAVTASFNEGVHWFLFEDEKGEFFGTCYLQSVHNYWRIEKRYYLGGFYIAPTHRGGSNLEDMYAQLQSWAKENNGVQIYVHIHPDNEKSIGAFKGVGMKEGDYRIFVHQWD